MSDRRDIWFASTRWGVQAYPITWQGWLLTFAYSVFVLAMVGLAEEMPRGLYTYSVVAGVFVVTALFLLVIFRHLRPRQESKG